MTAVTCEDLENSRLPFAARVHGTDAIIEDLARRCAPLGPIREKWNWNWLSPIEARFYFADREIRDVFISCAYLDIDAIEAPDNAEP